MINKLKPVIILIILFFTNVYSQKFNSSDFDVKIDSLMKIWHIPGCSIAIVKDSTLLYTKGYGYADIENKINANSNTIYGIASCSKAITCFALGLLSEQKKMDWDIPVRYYFPEFILEDSYISANITPLDLVTHRSGYAANDMLWYKSGKSRSELIELMRYLKPNKLFRTTFQYNNLMYVVAGQLIEKISGVTWENFVKENIFIPLEMKNSSFSIKDVVNNPNNSARYLLKNNIPTKIDMLDADNIGGAGSINSTVNDMANWLIMQVNKGNFKGKQIISESELNFLQKPAMAVGNLIAYPELYYLNYACGWYVTTYKGDLILRHAGALDGVSTLTSFMPDKKLGIIVIANLDEAANFTTSVSYLAYDLLNGNKLTDWSDRFIKENTEANSNTNNESEIHSKTHSLSSYLGEYYNLPYGKIIIYTKNDKLFFKYNMFDIPLKHITYNTFELEDDYVFYKMRINFAIDRTGKIDKIYIPFESKIADIEFIKK